MANGNFPMVANPEREMKINDSRRRVREDVREVVREEQRKAGSSSYGSVRLQSPTYTQLSNGQWQWIIGMSGFDTQDEARADWESFRWGREKK